MNSIGGLVLVIGVSLKIISADSFPSVGNEFSMPSSRMIGRWLGTA